MPAFFLSMSCLSKIQLQRQLSNTRVPGTRHLAEGSSGHDATGSQELRVIEDVIKLRAELQVQTFGQQSILEQREIKVIDSRPVKETTIGGSFHSQRSGCKCGGTEILSAGFARIGNIQRSDEVRSIDRESDWSAKRCSEQRVVIRFHYGYGQAGRKTGDSANLPSASQLFRSSKSVERKRVTIAGYEIMGGVESGKSATQSRIHRIDLFAVA